MCGLPFLLRLGALSVTLTRAGPPQGGLLPHLKSALSPSGFLRENGQKQALFAQMRCIFLPMPLTNRIFRDKMIGIVKNK